MPNPDKVLGMFDGCLHGCSHDDLVFVWATSRLIFCAGNHQDDLSSIAHSVHADISYHIFFSSLYLQSPKVNEIEARLTSTLQDLL